MPGPHDAARLRLRARTLRDAARRIETSPVMSLDRDAGPDTWHSPRVELCRAMLRANQTQLHHAVEGLRWAAHRLESRATEMEAAAAIAGSPS